MNDPYYDTYCGRAPDSVIEYYRQMIRDQGYIDIDITGCAFVDGVVPRMPEALPPDVLEALPDFSLTDHQ